MWITSRNFAQQPGYQSQMVGKLEKHVFQVWNDGQGWPEAGEQGE